MTMESFIHYGSLWTVLLGAISLAFAVRNYRRQVNAQIFFEIAGRYHNMLQTASLDTWAILITPGRELPEPNVELTSGALRYVAVVHFAFILHQLRYLSNDLWRILQAEHHRTLANPVFVREWDTVRLQFALFPDFVNYVESIQRAVKEAQVSARTDRHRFGRAIIRPFRRRAR